jgi:hypothetical protein
MIRKPAEERILGRIAREQFDAFEEQERLIRDEERADRAAKLHLPVQISIRLRQYGMGLRKKGVR